MLKSIILGTGAKIEHLQAVLFSHFHVDHSGALAWRVDIGHCAISFSGDMNNQGPVTFANDLDIFDID